MLVFAIFHDFLQTFHVFWEKTHFFQFLRGKSRFLQALAPCLHSLAPSAMSVRVNSRPFSVRGASASISVLLASGALDANRLAPEGSPGATEALIIIDKV